MKEISKELMKIARSRDYYDTYRAVKNLGLDFSEATQLTERALEEAREERLEEIFNQLPTKVVEKIKKGLPVLAELIPSEKAILFREAGKLLHG